MKYRELPRARWKPITCYTYGPDTHEFVGIEIGYQIYESVPENLWDLVCLWREQGIILNHIRIYEHDVELIPCINPVGAEGYYNPETEVFRTTETLFKLMDTNMQWSIR